MVDSRWAMTKLVRPFMRDAMAFWISTSVRVSTLLVASSRIRMAGSDEDGARDGEKLALALGDVRGLLVQHRVVARQAACG